MLKKPCEFFIPANHYINSLLFTIDPDEINKYLRENDKKVEKLITCPKCEIQAHSDFVNKSSMVCICEKNKFKASKYEKIQNQSRFDYFYQDSVNEKTQKKQVLIVLCLDNSGSMITTYRVPETENELIKGFISDRKKKCMFKAEFGEESVNFNEEHKYISRKELLLIYLKHDLQNLIKKNSNVVDYYVYVILFSSTVMIFGDDVSNNKPKILSESEFESIKNDPKKCMKFGRREGRAMYFGKPNPDIDLLFDKIEKETPNGTTALAPAIAIGLGFVKSLDPEPDTCQFMIFTDGRANNGFGNIEDPKFEEKSLNEYEQLGKCGFDWGVVFHLFAYEENAGLKFLTKMTNQTKFGENFKLTLEIKNNERFYDEDKFLEALKKAFTTPKNLTFVDAELKVYYDKRVKMQFCKLNQEYVEKSNVGTSVELLSKKIGQIYSKSEKIGMILEIGIKPKETFNIQTQLILKNLKDRKRYIIVFNLKTQVKKKCKPDFNVNFEILSKVMLEDEFQSDEEKRSKYLDFVSDYGDEESFNNLKVYFEKYQKNFKRVEKLRKKIDPIQKNEGKFDINKSKKNEKLNDSKEKEKKKSFDSLPSLSDNENEDSRTLNTLDFQKKLKEEEEKIFEKKEAKIIKEDEGKNKKSKK